MGFYQPEKLPKLMVAPNGARKIKKDHPAVPLTISETVETAKSCYEAGAGAIHLHVRDKVGQHVLDAGLYKEALNELEHQVPKMHIQVTTEAVGKYSPADMRKLAYDVTPPGVSIGTSELIPSRNPENEDIKLYKYLTEAGTKIQHILYQPEDIDLLINLLNKAEIQINGAWCLFVIGHYSGRISYPENISLFCSIKFSPVIFFNLVSTLVVRDIIVFSNESLNLKLSSLDRKFFSFSLSNRISRKLEL